MGRLNIRDIANEVGNLLEFRSNYRPYIFLLILIMLGLIPISFLEGLPNLSICSRIYGSRCYSIGLTRGLSALIKGKISLAINYNPLSIVVFVIMSGIILNDLTNRKSRKLEKRSY